MNIGKNLKLAIQDLEEGLLRWQLWTKLGWNDLQKRFRRSIIGPLWTMLSLFIFVVALGSIYAELMDQTLIVYIPHLVLGMAIWSFVSTVIMESSRVYVSEGQFLKQIRLPTSTFIYILIWRNLIIFFYQFMVFIFVLFFIDIPSLENWLLAVAGFILILANSLWMGLFVAVIAARFHDIGELLGNLLRIVFFITPIIWMPGSSAKHDIITDFNPFYHLIEVCRAYLLGNEASSISWLVSILLCTIGSMVALIFFGRYKNSIPFWI